MDGVKINPLLLQWARQRAGLSNEQLAKKVGLAQKPEVVRAWEAGSAHPTFRQTQALARALRISLGYLFLSAPPTTALPVTDFRTLPEAERGKFSPELEDVLNDALRKHDWLREWRTQEGATPLPFVGRFVAGDTPEKIAQDIRQVLDLPIPPARDAKSWNEHLRLLVRHAEEAGIIVLQSGFALSDTHRTLSVKEFRGFALTDEYAPLVFINARDSVAGRIFTLAHELGHLWTGTSGISNPTLEPTMPPGTGSIERLCNQVAAELLVPGELLTQRWGRQPNTLEIAQELAKQFRVSVFVILIRAYEVNLLPWESVQSAYAQAQQEAREFAPESERGGGDFYRTLRNRNGRLLMQEIITALRQGSLLYQGAARLLNIHPQTLETVLQQRLTG